MSECKLKRVESEAVIHILISFNVEGNCSLWYLLGL